MKAAKKWVSILMRKYNISPLNRDRDSAKFLPVKLEADIKKIQEEAKEAGVQEYLSVSSQPLFEECVHTEGKE